jgi:hypothetical protein
MVKISVNSCIIVYAFRYALGRMTYAVSDVIDVIEANIKDIPKNDILLMIKEISEAKFLGMSMDRIEWFKLCDELTEELTRREKKNDE